LPAWPEADLVRRFGKHGADLARHARGLDDRPIVVEHERKSVSQETTFSRDVSDRALLEQTLTEQAQDVSRILRQQQLAGTTVKLKLRWSDFTTLTRQTTLPSPWTTPRRSWRRCGSCWPGCGRGSRCG
jgi:DNA polymerase-4